MGVGGEERERGEKTLESLGYEEAGDAGWACG